MSAERRQSVTSWFQEFRLFEYLEMDLNFAVAGIALGWPCRSVCHRWSTRHGSRGLPEVNGAVKTSENLLCASSLFWAALWKCLNVYTQKPSSALLLHGNCVLYQNPFCITWGWCLLTSSTWGGRGLHQQKTGVKIIFVGNQEWLLWEAQN